MTDIEQLARADLGDLISAVKARMPGYGFEPVGPAFGDVARLDEVLLLLAKRGITPSFVVVGDIRVQVASSAPKDEQPKKAPSIDESEMAALRKRARSLFGRDYPDEALKEMRGAI